MSARPVVWLEHEAAAELADAAHDGGEDDAGDACKSHATSHEPRATSQIFRLKANKIESLSFPPVKTTLPETKINITIFGETILYTKPGNNSGS